MNLLYYREVITIAELKTRAPSDCVNMLVLYVALRVHSSGIIPECEHTEEKQEAFWGVTFRFQNERNTILVIPPPKVQ